MLDIIAKTSVISDAKARDLLLTGLTHPHTHPIIISWLNAHSFSVAQRDLTLRDSLLSSSYLLRDGVGIALLLHMADRQRGINMNGTDLIPEILRHFSGRKAAVFGTQEPFLSRAVAAIEEIGVTVSARLDGFQPENAYIDCLHGKKVDLIILGMGVPKQEKVSLLLAQSLPEPAVILNGGAILDFMSGRFPRAPRIVRKMRLEWLFRLLNEPARLWRRYIGSLPELAVYAYCIHEAAKEQKWK